MRPQTLLGLILSLGVLAAFENSLPTFWFRGLALGVFTLAVFYELWENHTGKRD